MSDLAAALVVLDSSFGLPIPAKAALMQAARQRLRLSRQPCQTCGGSGRVQVTQQIAAPDGSLLWTPGPCPACNGSGGVWPAELVEVVEKALTVGNKISETAAMRPELQHRFRERALVVLSAVESWMEAGK